MLTAPVPFLHFFMVRRDVPMRFQGPRKRGSLDGGVEHPTFDAQFDARTQHPLFPAAFKWSVFPLRVLELSHLALLRQRLSEKELRLTAQIAEPFDLFAADEVYSVRA